jgi:hypothetical protein
MESHKLIPRLIGQAIAVFVIVTIIYGIIQLVALYFST